MDKYLPRVTVGLFRHPVIRNRKRVDVFAGQIMNPYVPQVDLNVVTDLFPQDLFFTAE